MSNRSADAFQDDVAMILRALGISDHARSISAHLVVQDEILPEIRRLVDVVTRFTSFEPADHICCMPAPGEEGCMCFEDDDDADEFEDDDDEEEFVVDL
jgi:hypothetical protein